MKISNFLKKWGLKWPIFQYQTISIQFEASFNILFGHGLLLKWSSLLISCCSFTRVAYQIEHIQLSQSEELEISKGDCRRSRIIAHTVVKWLQYFEICKTFCIFLCLNDSDELFPNDFSSKKSKIQQMSNSDVFFINFPTKFSWLSLDYQYKCDRKKYFRRKPTHKAK